MIVKVGELECNAGEGGTHLRTYRPKAHVVDGRWHNGHENRRPRRAPKPSVTFSQLLAKYEKIGNKRNAESGHKGVARSNAPSGYSAKAKGSSYLGRRLVRFVPYHTSSEASIGYQQLRGFPNEYIADCFAPKSQRTNGGATTIRGRLL